MAQPQNKLAALDQRVADNKQAEAGDQAQKQSNQQSPGKATPDMPGQQKRPEQGKPGQNKQGQGNTDAPQIDEDDEEPAADPKTERP